MNIAENIRQLQQELASSECKIIAVSKTKPVSTLMDAYEAGVRDFGENKVQEMVEKYEQMPKDIQWHMIGHLQRNKVKYIAPFVHLVHSVDSIRLLEEINKQGAKHHRVISCLLQAHISEEENKYGFTDEEIFRLIRDETIQHLKYVQVVGLMGMASFTSNEAKVHKEFEHLKLLFDALKYNDELPDQIRMEEVSMGMSGDYRIAIKEGSTMVRIGTSIFGERNYQK
ncbi:MAG: YggS family pyridoxal phosphate-dependent enzyme [Tunicatimonas sp.]|uniref:YggS family pyridoxal phosphate-dependent enzyme n=1 Tax=Tunicatimonas sp. TaxID=1940096 RepID=UPI003C717C6F